MHLSTCKAKFFHAHFKYYRLLECFHREKLLSTLKLDEQNFAEAAFLQFKV